MLLLGFAFLSGLATILAPCIWPILPIVLSSSVGGTGKARPTGIVLGIMLSFSIATLTISTLVRILHFDPNILRTIATIIIALLGLTFIIPSLSTILEGWVSRLSSLWGGRGGQGSAGFGPGFLTGLSLGVVWAPCAGPILASIAALSVTGQVTLYVVALTVTYTIGVGIPLFIIAYGGQRIVTGSRRIAPYTGRIQQFFGVIMIITAVLIYTNYDKVLQLKLLEFVPSYSSVLSGFEQSGAVTRELGAITGATPTTGAPSDLSTLFNANTPAPEVSGSTQWLNTDAPLTLKSLRGHVVLVDFWTYTCINCIRTLPHVTGWYEKYKDQGFIVVGVHTPEFEFEKNTQNVKQANQRYNIHYPVVQDNEYQIWNAFRNHYWPAEYLIDASGAIRRTHFGEGEYDEMEQAIQTLLNESGKKVSTTLENMPDLTPKAALSPETYLGSARMEYYYPLHSLVNGEKQFTLATTIPKHSFSLGGTWTIESEHAVAGSGAQLVYHFNANNVFLVLRPGKSTSGSITVFLDDKPVSSGDAGADVKHGIMTVDTDRLYHLIDFHGNPGNHVLRLEFQTPGIEAFAFTFG